MFHLFSALISRPFQEACTIRHSAPTNLLSLNNPVFFAPDYFLPSLNMGIKQNLKQNNLTEEWLYRELNKRGINDVKDVVFANLDTQGNLHIDLRKYELKSPRDIND